MRSFSDRRISLWVALVLLLLALLATLVWLAGRYEASQVQAELERGAADAVSDIRSGLSRNNQALLAVPAWSVSEKNWQIQAQSLLSQNREWLRMEWRDAQGLLLAHENSPLRVPAFDNATR
ncbi:MAG: PAS domain-containing sensor histidine kinase, partial [Rhodoferax sp.]|nr:PAS domain-containing sensor histidine kinase [Rhodoferax sp.]